MCILLIVSVCLFLTSYQTSLSCKYSWKITPNNFHDHSENIRINHKKSYLWLTRSFLDLHALLLHSNLSGNVRYEWTCCVCIYFPFYVDPSFLYDLCLPCLPSLVPLNGVSLLLPFPCHARFNFISTVALWALVLFHLSEAELLLMDIYFYAFKTLSLKLRTMALSNLLLIF